MVSFFRPKGKRTKILCEAKAFPSDQYALASQLRYHGLEPSEHLIEIGPRHGEHHIHQEDLRSALDQYGDQIAMMMIGGVNYYTGQVMDMKTLTAYAQSKGILVGWDLHMERAMWNYNCTIGMWILPHGATTNTLTLALAPQQGILYMNAITGNPKFLVLKAGGGTINKHVSKCQRLSNLFLPQKLGSF